MKEKSRIERSLCDILTQYQQSFSNKIYLPENNEPDLLMDVFAITPEMKRENRQYWGRELGMCWQRLVTELCRQACREFGPALRFGYDEPCDFIAGNLAVDTKYRIGSGDSGTLKKFRGYAKLLMGEGLEPVLLIVRKDNLPAAINACLSGGWKVLMGDETFDYIRKLTGFNLKRFLQTKAMAYRVQR